MVIMGTPSILRLRAIAAGLAVIAGCAAFVGAQPQQPETPEHEPVQARLTTERSALLPGRLNLIGVVLDIEPGWHVYADARNDTGMGTTVAVVLPQGFEAREAMFPAPHRHLSAGHLLDHVYEGTLVAFVPVQVPMEAAGETVRITGSAQWLVCREICVLGEATDLTLEVRVARSAAELSDSPDTALFLATKRRLPRPLMTALGSIDVQLEREGSTLRLVASSPGATRLAFYPDARGPEPIDLLGRGETAGERLVLGFEPPAEPGGEVSGTLEVWGPQAEPPSRLYRVSLPLESMPSPDGPVGEE